MDVAKGHIPWALTRCRHHSCSLFPVFSSVSRRSLSCSQVQNLIERCLQLYMSQREVVATLQFQAKIEPGFTRLGNESIYAACTEEELVEASILQAGKALQTLIVTLRGGVSGRLERHYYAAPLFCSRDTPAHFWKPSDLHTGHSEASAHPQSVMCCTNYNKLHSGRQGISLSFQSPLLSSSSMQRFALLHCSASHYPSLHYYYSTLGQPARSCK